jgi:hypothetical protein
MAFLENDHYGIIEDATAVLLHAESAIEPALELVSQHVDRGEVLSDEDVGTLAALLEDALEELRSHLVELRIKRGAVEGTGHGRKRGA